MKLDAWQVTALLLGGLWVVGSGGSWLLEKEQEQAAAAPQVLAYGSDPVFWNRLGPRLTYPGTGVFGAYWTTEAGRVLWIQTTERWQQLSRHDRSRLLAALLMDWGSYKGTGLFGRVELVDPQGRRLIDAGGILLD